ncbi:MAG: T9SS type A sorting domain-containing protein [Bacteroidales bacterium]|nr:T9SS type A sorting domain-containing protein [Bacteroidales bacterium]
MKKLVQPMAFLISILLQFQLAAQPGNTPDILVTTEVNIDQYNPSVFVNPWNPDVVINSNQRFNHTIQGQTVFFAMQPTDFFHSQNSANTWNAGSSLPQKTSSNNYPAVQIDKNCRYYLNYGDSNIGIFMAWSDDMGNTWDEKLLKAKPDQPLYYVSTNNFWIDNSERSMYNGNVYAAWRFVAYESSNYCIELSRSEYGSDEWSNPANICSFEAGDNTFEEWPVVKTGPNGEVYTCWMNHDGGPGTGETSIGFNSSFDGGNNFGINRNILTNIKGLSGYQNLIGLNLISAPDMAVDVSGGPNDGNLYIVWANVGVPGTNTGQDVDIYMITSETWGNDWSVPGKVNQDPLWLSKEHFMPAITCDPETGTLTVIYYDNRNLGSNMLEVWGSVSFDGGSNFSDFKISDVAMNRTNLISYDGNFISDKIGVSSANGKVVPVWADFRNQFCRTVTSPFNEKPVAKPNDLQAQVIDWDNGTVLLSWTMESPAGVQHYNIYRDNQLIGTTNQIEFQDNLTVFGNYTYRVTAQFESMESAPVTDFMDWGAGEFSANRDNFDVKLAPGTQTTYVLKLINEGTLPVDYSFTIDHDPGASVPIDSDPDDFGYQWIDSDNPGGPGFDYIDISGTGIEITGILNDNSVGPFSMGFSFPFYDNYYDEFYISSNGIITFGGSFSNPVNSPIPTQDGNNNFIAWCWDDLQKKTGGQVFYQQFEEYTVIQFKEYAQNGTLSLRYVINAEVILYKNGDVLIQYLDYTTGLFLTNSCTIGIENGSGNDGLQVAFNQAYLHEELAIRFFNPGVKWIYMDLPYGTIDPGSESAVLVNFKSLDFPLGEYFANVNFKTNAVGMPNFVIPVRLEVASSVLAKPANLDFTLTGNDLDLTWLAPSGKGLLGYNVYESGEKVNESLITQTNYQINNLEPGACLFQVTALYSEGESNPEGNPLFVFVSTSAQQQVQISNGWSGISSYVEPLNPDFESVFSSVGDDLVILMGEDGFYWPGQNINTLGNWVNETGYKIKLLQEQNLTFTGSEMSLPVVSCDEGWSLIPVLTSCEVSPVDVFSYGLENLVIIKEAAGTEVYWPQLGIFTLQTLKPGKAYEMNLTGMASLYFPDCPDHYNPDDSKLKSIETPWNLPFQTGLTHTIGLTIEAVSQLEPGDIIGAFNQNGLCVGLAENAGTPTALTVFGDDPTTTEIDGMQDGEMIAFRIYRPSNETEYEAQADFAQEMPNAGQFANNGLSAITGFVFNLTAIDEIPATFQIYPNPSSGSMNIKSGIDGSFTLSVFNAQGQAVYKKLCSDVTTMCLNLDLPDGVYFIQVSSEAYSKTQKILIKQ